MYFTSLGMLRPMSPSSMMRPVSTEGSRENTDDTRMHSSTSAICFLYGASQENTRFISGSVTLGRFFFSSSVRYRRGPPGGGIQIPPCCYFAFFSRFLTYRNAASSPSSFRTVSIFSSSSPVSLWIRIRSRDCMK